MKAARSAAAAIALAALTVQGASAQGASAIIGGLQALNVDEHFAVQAQLCSTRFGGTAEVWATALAGFRGRNAAPLEELRQLRRELMAKETERLEKERVLAGMLAMSGMFPHMTLAPLRDDAAGTACDRWREALAPGADAERRLPAALEAARKLRPPSAAPAAAPAR